MPILDILLVLQNLDFCYKSMAESADFAQDALLVDHCHCRSLRAVSRVSDARRLSATSRLYLVRIVYDRFHAVTKERLEVPVLQHVWIP